MAEKGEYERTTCPMCRGKLKKEVISKYEIKYICKKCGFERVKWQ